MKQLNAVKNEYGLLSCTMPGVESVQKDENRNKTIVYASANPEETEKEIRALHRYRKSSYKQKK